MKNKDDYDNGWTTSIINEKTGKKISGGAARNHRTGQLGGATGIQALGGLNALNYVQPYVESLQQQLQKSQELNEKFAEIIAAVTQKRRTK